MNEYSASWQYSQIMILLERIESLHNEVMRMRSMESKLLTLERKYAALCKIVLTNDFQAANELNKPNKHPSL